MYSYRLLSTCMRVQWSTLSFCDGCLEHFSITYPHIALRAYIQKNEAKRTFHFGYFALSDIIINIPVQILLRHSIISRIEQRESEA